MMNNSININEATSDIKHTKTTTYPDVNPGPDFGQIQLCRVDIAKYQPCEEMWNFNGDIKIFDYKVRKRKKINIYFSNRNSWI
jgi:hypothetical protein